LEGKGLDNWVEIKDSIFIKEDKNTYDDCFEEVKQKDFKHCNFEKKTLVQLVLKCGKSEIKDMKTYALCVFNREYFKQGKQDCKRRMKIVKVRERMLENRTFIQSYPSPEDIIFSIDEKIRVENIQPKIITRILMYPFKIYNVRDSDQYTKLVNQFGKTIDSRKKRFIVPSQLVTLVALNMIDSYLAKPNTSKRFFKTWVLKDLDVGRRASATRELKRKGYIEQWGNRWRRTEKPFDESDFYPQ